MNIKSLPKKLTNLEKIIRSRALLKKYVKEKIEFSKPILTIKDQPLFHAKNINVVQGKYGTHKSRFAEHICSTLLMQDNCNINLIGLELNTESELMVCYVDTERNWSDQYSYSLQQIILNSGHKLKDEIKNFDFISLIEIDRKERFDSLCQYLEKLREDFKGHIIVILDVLTDLVENFNDPKQSLKLIDLLNTTINIYDTTFICLIHENPGDNFKARGHLVIYNCTTATPR
ncbi:hypothetical protein ACFLSS_03070 [Bacteroidota bacterium]